MVQKNKDLTFLTFKNHLRIQQASANLHQLGKTIKAICI